MRGAQLFFGFRRPRERPPRDDPPREDPPRDEEWDDRFRSL
jgi:hypothetical protein